MDSECSDEIDSDEGEILDKPKKVDDKIRIPPIVVYSHVHDHMKTLNDIKESDVEIKANNRIIVYTKTEDDYQTFIEKIKAAKVKYHTYSFPNKTLIKSVLKGVPANVKPEEIMHDLKNKYNLKMIEVK